MATAADVFSATGFSLIEMMDAVNKIPYAPGRISELGIFAEKGITTTTVQVEEKNGLLSLVPTSIWGAPATQSQREGRVLRSFTVPHLQLEDTVNAMELQNVRAFGSVNQAQDMDTVRNERLTVMTRWMDATLEHLRMGALKGTILDADGTTTILNTFTAFGVSQVAEYAFNFAGGTVDPAATANAIVRSIQDELGASSPGIDHVHALCSPTFFDDFVSNQKVKDSYARYTDAATAGMVGAFLRDSHVRQPPFPWNGIWWEEYRGPNPAIGSFVPTDKALFFPVGVPNLFVNYFAPADFSETVNTVGLPRYARAAMDPEFGRWVKMHLQSNPLPLCLRPRVLQIARRGA